MRNRFMPCFLVQLWGPFRHGLLVPACLAAFASATAGQSGSRAAAAAPAASDRPNVVVIMTDDQGYGDFGATGNEVIETPNLDAMAGRSAAMETFYVHPVCSPTRACLMTGRYNYRTRVIDTWQGRSMMEPEETTIAEVLGEAGYATGIFGKWHLGDNYPMRPIDQGFEEALVHRGGGLGQPSEPRENERRYTDPILFRNGEKVQTEGYCTDVYFDAAIDFIEKSKSQQQNFFVYLPTNAPHGPYHDVPEDLRKQYLEKADQLAELIVDPPQKSRRLKSQVDRLARIAAMITNVDENVGRLFQKLDQLELTRDTVVIFLTDNGPNTRRYVGRFRGKKGEVHEGGVRTVLWVHWPAKLNSGTSSREVAAHIDLMPTILDACQVEVPEGVQLDGRSFLKLLTGEQNEWPERPLVIQSHRGDQPVRYHHFLTRLGRWKLLHGSGFGREEFEGQPEFELYDVVDDPGETENLIDQRPEVAARLRGAYNRWFDDVSSTREDNYAPPRIHIGSPHENPAVLTRQDWRGGSWSRNAIGHWLLQVEKKAPYDIRLLIEPASAQETARLQVGGVSREKAVPAGADEVLLEDVELPAGSAKLQAELIGEDQQPRGVYQVVVQRQTE